ncbi:hypothetical protein NL676_031129 [Syzygium grande]|nr:hypothetical protein NL676_031129 [Syzygium grande]
MLLQLFADSSKLNLDSDPRSSFGSRDQLGSILTQGRVQSKAQSPVLRVTSSSSAKRINKQVDCMSITHNKPSYLEFTLRSVSLTPTSEVHLLARRRRRLTSTISVLQFEPVSLEQQEQQEGTRPISTSGAPEFGNQASEGWHSLMLVRIEVYLKCGILGSSHFHR